MQIAGKERHFEYLIACYDEICALCPGGDIGRIDEALGDQSKGPDMAIGCAIAMNHCYEDHQHYLDPSHEPDYLTRDDFKFEPVYKIRELYGEIAKAFKTGNAQTVKTEPVKRKTGRGRRKDPPEPELFYLFRPHAEHPAERGAVHQHRRDAGHDGVAGDRKRKRKAGLSASHAV